MGKADDLKRQAEALLAEAEAEEKKETQGQPQPMVHIHLGYLDDEGATPFFYADGQVSIFEIDGLVKYAVRELEKFWNIRDAKMAQAAAQAQAEQAAPVEVVEGEIEPEPRFEETE